MNTYSWVQPTGSHSLTLQKDGNALAQITKEGVLVSSGAVFTSLLEDPKFEGHILVMDSHGMVRKAPITLSSVSSEINDYITAINEEVKKTLIAIKQEDEKVINKVVADCNQALSAIQQNSKFDISQTIKDTERQLSRVTALERMTWIMLVLIILLLAAVVRLFLKQK